MATVLGINTFMVVGGHDSAATIVKDGRILSSIQEERMTGVKHDGSVPFNAVKEAMRVADVAGSDIDAIACSWESFPLYTPTALIRPLNYVRFAIRKAAMMKIKAVFGIKGGIHFVNHHKSHAASAFYTSGFKDCTNIVIDGRGDYESISVYENMERKRYYPIPVSPGLFYGAVTQALGFKQEDGEGKTMGLACYGQPTYCEEIKTKLPNIDLIQKTAVADPSDKRPFAIYRYIKSGGADDFREMLGLEKGESPGIGKLGKADKKLWQKYADMAASAQKHLEDRVLGIVEKHAGGRSIALSGGVFLNCKLNQRIREAGYDVFIHPAAGDSGAQTGAALEICRKLDPDNFKPERMEHTYFGTEFTEEEIEKEIRRFGFKYERLGDAAGTAADLISKSHVVGWFQGRMEYGPRALGNRSVLADPTDPKMRDRINTSLKRRDWFMPFCPSILDKAKEEYFIGAVDAPFMIMTFDVPKEKLREIPAVVHVDGTCRPQTLRKEINGKYWRLIKEFEKCKVPLVLNTSFNRHGLPMIRTPREALDHLLWRCVDTLVIGDFLVEREFARVS